MFRKRINDFIGYWIPLLAYCGLIFIISHSSQPTGQIELPINDKVIHFFEFALLGVLAIRAMRHGWFLLMRRYATINTIIFCCTFAIFDEWHQMYVAMRDASLLDLTADIAGCISSVLLYAYFVKGNVE